MNRRRFLFSSAAAPLGAAMLPACGGSGRYQRRYRARTGPTPAPGCAAHRVAEPAADPARSASLNVQTKIRQMWRRRSEHVRHRPLRADPALRDRSTTSRRVASRDGYISTVLGRLTMVGQRRSAPTTRPTPYWSSDGRQEMWFADVGTTALNSGTVRFKLAQNYYHNYPWDGTGGYFGPGRPGGGAGPQRGPFMPDGLGLVVDKRGEFWMGPCAVGYTSVTGDAAGESFQYWAPMYKWNMPGLHSNGVRRGNGWTRPNQNRLKSPGSGGQPGTDFDVGVFTDSEFLGVGRPNTSAYDPTSDAIYVVGVGGSSTTLNVALYKFPCVPQAGQHTWTREALSPKALSDLGLPNATSGPQAYGDRAGSGCIANTVVCNGKLYFTFVTSYGVPSGSGNATSTLRKIAWIISVDLSTKAVDWVPFPSVMNWWLRPFDGPQAADAHNVTSPGTPAQYRSLKAVGNETGHGSRLVAQRHERSVDRGVRHGDTDVEHFQSSGLLRLHQWRPRLATVDLQPRSYAFAWRSLAGRTGRAWRGDRRRRRPAARRQWTASSSRTSTAVRHLDRTADRPVQGHIIRRAQQRPTSRESVSRACLPLTANSEARRAGVEGRHTLPSLPHVVGAPARSERNGARSICLTADQRSCSAK